MHSRKRYMKGCGHRRHHHTTKKNQKTRMMKTIYQSQRQPCRSAIRFMRRNVPARMPDVSEKASFCIGVNNCSACTRALRTISLSCLVESRTSLPMAKPTWTRVRAQIPTSAESALTSFSSLTFAVKPSSCSSF
jgi:hypothetical protein